LQLRIIAAVAWVGAVAIHSRVEREPAALSPSSAPVLAVLSGGHTTAAASAAWSSTVLHYANTTADPSTVAAGIHTALRFDPSLQPPVVHGVMMLQRLGATEEVPALLQHGMHEFPDESWFPWAMGMHLWLAEDSPDAAAEWLERAADLSPDSIHRDAAAALRARP